MIESILFVCPGNICRSSVAEALFRRETRTRGVSLRIDSAATSAWHIGDPPDPRCIVAARAHGFDISDQRSRILRPEDFQEFDLIIVMDEEGLEEVQGRRPHGAKAQIRMISEFRNEEGPRDVPDPYFTSRFDPMIEMIAACMSGLVSYTVAAQ